MISAHKLLCCPLCRSAVTEELKCLSCAEQYSLREGVYVMVNQALSANEWKWDERHLSEEGEESPHPYGSFINQETRDAQRIWHDALTEYTDMFCGYVIDVATGKGGMLAKLLESNAAFFPIATDVDPNVLVWTRRALEGKYPKEFLAVASDAKHLAFGDDVLDYATSLAGLNNIPDTILALGELRRTLRHGGKLVVMNTFVEEDSNSAELARQHNTERAFIERHLISDLTGAGFRNVKTNTVASAIWAENPHDLLPVAGDMQYYAIIEAEK